MQTLKVVEILNAVGGSLICGSSDADIKAISTDSRNVSPGDLFVPIVGERFDGHDFLEPSLINGATAAITQKDTAPLEGKIIIRVSDTLKALGDIAAYYRLKFKIPFVAITGSVGKTSTKDMVASVLEQEYNILSTKGNFNNEIGLPKTIFGLDTSHRIGVVEMGMSGFGEISRLTAIAKPDIAIITNIGLAHIEKLGSRQNILKAKMEILEGLSENGLVLLNGDDNLLLGLKGLLNKRTVFYGLEEGLDYQAFNIMTAGEHGTYFEIIIGDVEYKVHVPVPGVHNVYNALAAIAVGVEFGIPVEKILAGIEKFQPGKMRMNIITNSEIKIINDTYNASPQSMEAAIDVLDELTENGRSIAVLGDMLEMGDWSYKAHLSVGVYAASKGIDTIITVGENGADIAKGAIEAGMNKDFVKSFDDNKSVVEYLKGYYKDGDVILVKGSRGMKMEEIVEKLTNDR